MISEKSSKLVCNGMISLPTLVRSYDRPRCFRLHPRQARRHVAGQEGNQPILVRGTFPITKGAAHVIVACLLSSVPGVLQGWCAVSSFPSSTSVSAFHADTVHIRASSNGCGGRMCDTTDGCCRTKHRLAEDAVVQRAMAVRHHVRRRFRSRRVARTRRGAFRQRRSVRRGVPTRRNARTWDLHLVGRRHAPWRMEARRHERMRRTRRSGQGTSGWRIRGRRLRRRCHRLQSSGSAGEPETAVQAIRIEGTLCADAAR